jgi:hypothetical protein
VDSVVSYRTPHRNSADDHIADGNESALDSSQGLPSVFQRIPHIAGLPDAAPPSNPPQTASGKCEYACESDKPNREIGNGIALGFFPKPIIFAFFGGALVGCCIVAGAVIQGQRDKNPKGKRD